MSEKCLDKQTNVVRGEREGGTEERESGGGREGERVREREGRSERGDRGREGEGGRERKVEGIFTCDGPVSRKRRFMPEMVARSNISRAFLATELLGLVHRL